MPPDPTAEPIPETTPEPTDKPTADPAPEPTQEPTAEATPEPSEGPAADPAPEATPEPTAEAAPEPTEEPAADPAPEPTTEVPLTLHVADLDGASAAQNKNKWEASVSIVVVDGEQVPLADAVVSATWSQGQLGPATCTSDANGVCSLSSGHVDSEVGSVALTVDAVDHDTHSYDAGANGDPDGDSDGTQITINQPQ
jgi:hypothetical protein